MEAKIIKGLVFDMDGLIFDTERIVKRSWDDVGTRLGIEHMGEHIFHTIGFNRERREAYFRTNIREDFPAEEFGEQTRKRFYEIADQEGIAVKPGAGELMAYAKEHGYRLALATSSRRAYAEKLLKEAGLYGYFDGFVFGDMVTHSKPDPEVYLKACAQIGLTPEACIALEDAPAGIRSANGAGLCTCMIPDLVEPEETVRQLADYIFQSLHEVITLLETLSRQCVS